MLIPDAPWIGRGRDDCEGEREVYGHCAICGEEIYYGDELYEICEEKVCRDCIVAARTLAR